MRNEPIVIVNSIAAAVEAILIAAVAFGLDVTAEQLGTVSAAIIAVGQSLATILSRDSVFSPATMEQIVVDVAAGRAAGLTEN